MSPGSKPNLDRLNLIQHLRDEGLTLAEIAERVGVSRQAVHHALLRKRKLSGSTICSVCGVTHVAAAGVACQKCLGGRADLPLQLRLTSLRVLARLSQKELADATGFSQSLISTLETGSHQARQKTWEQLFAFLNSAVATDFKRKTKSRKREGHAASPDLSSVRTNRQSRPIRRVGTSKDRS